MKPNTARVIRGASAQLKAAYVKVCGFFLFVAVCMGCFDVPKDGLGD